MVDYNYITMNLFNNALVLLVNWSSEVRAQSGLRGERKWPVLTVLFSLSFSHSSGLFTFLPEGD
jgi:hypothetical protein